MSSEILFSDTRLYVANLPRDTDDNDKEIIEIFESFGKIIDRTNRSEHHFIFLEYLVPEQARAAHASMNGYKYKNHTLKVQFAKKREFEKKNEKDKAKGQNDLEKYLQAGGMTSWVGGQQVRVPATGIARQQDRMAAAADSRGDVLYSGWTAGAGAGNNGAAGYSGGGGYSAPPPSYAIPYDSSLGEGGGFDASQGGGFDTSRRGVFDNSQRGEYGGSREIGGGYDNSQQQQMNYGYSSGPGPQSQGSNNKPAQLSQQPPQNMQYEEELPEYTDKWATKNLLGAAKGYFENLEKGYKEPVTAEQGGAEHNDPFMRGGNQHQQRGVGQGGGEGRSSIQRDRSSENPRDRSNLRTRWTDDKNGREKDNPSQKLTNDAPMDVSPPAQANDVEIVCPSQEYTSYAEWIEERLGIKGLKVDILYPNPEITLVHLLSNIAARKGIFAIVLDPDSREKRFFDVYVLRGEIQEHKSMPETDAISYIVRNYSKLSSKHTGKVESAERPNFGITSEISRIFLDIRDDRDLDIAAYDKAIQYLVDNREGLLKDEYGIKVPTHLLVPPCTPAKESMLRGKQEEVQEYILEILNKNPDILTQTKQVPKIKLAEPSVNKNNSTSADINMMANSGGNHQTVIGSNFDMKDMGKLFGMMQTIMKSNPNMFNS